MRKIYVTRDARNMEELLELDLEDVLYIENYERTIALHTSEGMFFPLMPSLSTYEQHMKHLNFQRLDRTNLINMNKARIFDEDKLLIFFDDSSENKGKFGTVSKNARRLAKQQFDKRNGGE